jgi:SAM-dependent methyltransferase
MEYSEFLTEYYESRYDQWGVGPRALDWKDSNSMKMLFDALARIEGFESDDSVADIGCGFADFCSYLSESGWSGNYSGYDLVPEFIKEAKRRFEQHSFFEGDFLNLSEVKRHDWFVASGTFNVKFNQIENFTERMIEKMFANCDKGIAFNAITDYVNYEVPNLAYNSPQKLFDFCKSLTPFVTLRHDYYQWQFTIYMYKDRVKFEA